MNPHQVTAFAQVVREGSFVRAAERLGLTQSAVSQHVANFETAVGAPLLIRGRSGLTLTRAGQEFYELADRYVTLSQLIGEKIEGFANLERGYLSVIANAPRPALEHIAAFQRLNPQVEIEFTLWDWTTAMRLLRQRQVDVGIVTEPKHLEGCIVREIGAAGYVAYLLSSHRLADRAAIEFRDLVGETVLLPEEGSFTARTVAEKTRKHGIALQPVMKTTTFPLMKEAVLHGVGVGIFLEDGIQPAPSLITRPIVEMPERYATCLVTPSDRARLRAVQRFTDLVLD